MWPGGGRQIGTTTNTFLLSQEIYRPPSSSPPRDTEVTFNAHHRTYGSVFSVLCSLYFIVLYIGIVRFDSCIERVWCFVMFTFLLKELTPQTVLRFGCVLVKNILKSILTTKRKTVWFVTAKRKTVWKPELESAPQRETQTQQLSWRGVARGAVRDSQTRRRYTTCAVR